MGAKKLKIKRGNEITSRNATLEELVAAYLVREHYLIDGHPHNAISIAVNSLINLATSAENEMVRAIAASKLLDFCGRLITARQQREAGINSPVVITATEKLMDAIDKAIADIVNEDSPVESE